LINHRINPTTTNVTTNVISGMLLLLSGGSKIRYTSQ